MKLQLALDVLNLEESFKLLDEVHDLLDIVEIGTPWIVKEGVINVKNIRDRYHDFEVLADVKIMDGAKLETDYALDMGADIVTVMALTNNVTIQAVIDETHARGKKTLIDMMNVKNYVERAKELVAMGADYICIHTATDTTKKADAALDELKNTCEAIGSDKVVLAGGVTLENLDLIVPYNPATIICGTAIIKASDKRKYVTDMKTKMNGNL